MTETSLDDAALLAGFTDATLPGAAFGHREHVRVAFLFLHAHADFGAAAVAFRAALRRFVAALGAGDRYHETLTWAYLALVHEHMHGHDDVDSPAFVRRCPELAQHRGGELERRGAAGLAAGARGAGVAVARDVTSAGGAERGGGELV